VFGQAEAVISDKSILTIQSFDFGCDHYEQYSVMLINNLEKKHNNVIITQEKLQINNKLQKKSEISTVLSSLLNIHKNS